MREHLEYPDCSLYSFLKQNAGAYADACALEYFGKKRTYSSLLAEIERCAGALLHLGVQKGDAVSICLPNIPQAVIAFYAINCIGAVANMIHPLSAPKELLHALTVSQSRVVIVVDLAAEKLQHVLPQSQVEHIVYVSVAEDMPLHLKLAYRLTNRQKSALPSKALGWKSFRSLGEGQAQSAAHGGDGADCAVILYSGGTTGKPKGIMLSNLNFNALALQSIESCCCLQQGDRVLSVMPVFHGFGLGVCVHTVLNFGGTAILLPKFKVAEFHKLLFRYKPNVIAGVPAIYESFIRSNVFAGKDLSFLKCVISGGDSLSAATKAKMNRLLADCNCGVTVREGYGLTECVTGSCLIPDHSEKLDSVGLPYPDTVYRILDPESSEVMSTGEIGEIVLRGPSVMLGYLNEPEETANTLCRHSDGYIWLHTGDLGYMDDEGYVYFCQRRKRMIVSGGYNIYPQTIENIISMHPQVVMCAVVGVPDEIMGQRVKAYVVLRENPSDTETVKAQLMQSLKEEIAQYALPREIAFVSSLPRTLVGKIAYTELMRAEEAEVERK